MGGKAEIPKLRRFKREEGRKEGNRYDGVHKSSLVILVSDIQAKSGETVTKMMSLTMREFNPLDLRNSGRHTTKPGTNVIEIFLDAYLDLTLIEAGLVTFLVVMFVSEHNFI